MLDVDGTLVDTNYQHAIAWNRALREHGYVVRVREIHRHIGMGGDLSSANAEEVERYLDLLDARDLVDGWTTAADVERTKPHPDLVHAALAKAGEGLAVMVGDSSWDVKAATAAGIPTLAVLTGGLSEEELREAGAAELVRSIGELRKDRQVLATLARRKLAGTARL